MKIMIIGQSGAGKSTLARTLHSITAIPLFPLDRLWLTTDYTKEAKKWFDKEQKSFMETNTEWIIEGNYPSSINQRIKQADLILLLRITRGEALYRIIKRSIKRKFNINTRPDVPEEFTEKFDKEYIKFLAYAWNFQKETEPVMIEKINKLGALDKLIILKGRKQQAAFLEQIDK
ncbi:MAG: topology modulation protein [Enterococcus sp.]